MVEKTSFIAPAPTPDVSGRRSMKDRQESGAFERMMDSVRKRWSREPHTSDRIDRGNSPSRNSLEERLERLRDQEERSEKLRTEETGTGQERSGEVEANDEQAKESSDVKVSEKGVLEATSGEKTNVSSDSVGDAGDDVPADPVNEEGESTSVELTGSSTVAVDAEGGESGSTDHESEGGVQQGLTPSDDESPETGESEMPNVKAAGDSSESDSIGGKGSEVENESGDVQTNPDTGSTDTESGSEQEPMSGEKVTANETREGGTPVRSDSSEGATDRSREETSQRGRRIEGSQQKQEVDGKRAARPITVDTEQATVTKDADGTVPPSTLEEADSRSLKATQEALEAMLQQRRLREGKIESRQRSESHVEKFKGEESLHLSGERIGLNLGGEGSQTGSGASESGSSTPFAEGFSTDAATPFSEEPSNESNGAPDPIREWVELRGGSQHARSSIRLDQMPVANLELRRQILPSLTRGVSRVSSGDPTRQGEWQKHQVTLDDGQKLNLLARRDGDLLQLKLRSSNPELNRLLVEHQQEIRQHLEKECGMEIDLQFDQSEDSDGSQFEEWMESGTNTAPTVGNSPGEDPGEETTEAHTRIRSFGYNRMEWTG